MSKKKEKELYAPIMKALEDKFSLLGECHFEDTSDRFSEELKDELDPNSVFILKVEGMRPDLTGYVIESEKNEFNIVVVEIKNRPTLEDIYQTKRYAEVLGASYGLLISPKRLSVERRNFLKIRKGKITSFFPNKQVGSGLNKHILIGLYDETTKSIRFEPELYGNFRIDEKHYNVIFGVT
jgi:hypothetical protein